MSDKLSVRQQAILAAIVEQFAEVASPVGSVTLARLFGVSSATVRNDMMVLEEMGYLMHPHTSAGRIPTDQGYRFYVNALGEKKDPAKATGQAIDRSARVINARISQGGGPEQVIRSAVRSLVELTHNVGLATISGSLYIRGFADLFSQPDFASAATAFEVASLLDNLEPWLKEAAPNNPLSVYIGRENPIGKSSGCSLVISRFRSPYSDRSYIGVLGPTRQDYRRVMQLVGQTGETLERALA